MNYKKLFFNLAFIFMFYLIFGLFLFVNQYNIMFYPSNQDFYDCSGFEDFEKINYNDTRFYLKHKNQNILIHYHGNAGSACDRSALRPHLENFNGSLLFLEYAGFSNDERTPTPNKLLQDVKNLVNFLEENNYENITIYAESIGSGPASYHARIAPVKKIILSSPFSSLKALAQSKYIIYPANFLLRENLDNIYWLENFEGEVIIFHGEQDNIVPKRFSKELYDALNTEQKQYISIPNRGHNDLWLSEEFKELIIKKLN